MQNALRGLRDTLPKSGQYNTLGSLMRQYGTGGGAIGPVQTASVGTNRLASMGARVGSQQPQDRGGESGVVGSFDPQAVNTEQETQLADIQGVGNVSMRDVAFGMMPDKMGGLSSAALSGLQEAVGPHAVTGMYGSPSLSQIGSQQAQNAMATAGARNSMAAGQISPQAAFGGMAAPVNPGFMAGQQMSFTEEADSMFAEAMGGVASGRDGGGRPGGPSAGSRSESGAARQSVGSRGGGGAGPGGRGTNGGMGGGVGDVGAGNPGGTGVL
jgi:hypothetical protein